tara:strand:- start:4601 stop:4735 length:135 start_codon:yes stop_codon:yes gene_type:complete
MRKIIKRAIILSRKNSEWFAASNQKQPATKEVSNEDEEIRKGRV